MDIIIPMIDGRGKVDSLDIRERAIECVALIVAAVGKENFAVHQQEVMNVVTELVEAELPPDDPRTTAFPVFWSNVAGTLGEDLKPYLDRILPHLLRAAVRQPNIRMFIDGGFETASVKVKEGAFNMLYWIARSNPKAIQPHISQILPICLDSLNFDLDRALTSVSLNTMCSMLEIISRTEEPATVQATARQIYHALVEAVMHQRNEVYVAKLDSLCKVSTFPSSITIS